ncbi:MAG TPA: phosphopantetheine-binding protein, partial [Steroidobacteraceae bacterium]
AIGRAWLAGIVIDWRGLRPANISFASPPSSHWSAPPAAALAQPAAPAAASPANEAVIAPAADAAAPSEREQQLLTIWSRALGRDDIGVNDSFGAMGGDSLSSIAVIMEMKRVGVPDALARGIYQDLTIREIAAQEVGLPTESGGWLQLSLIETPVFIRAAAIFLVVAGHFALLDVYGAYTLMMVSGLSFGMFQLKAIERESGVRPIFRLILKIGIPTLVWVILEEVVFHAIRPRSWLFYDNWISPYWDAHFGSPYFIDLLLQNLLLTAVPLSFPAVRRYAIKQPYAYAVAFLAVAWLLNVIIPFFWDTNYLFDRLPYMWLWLFAYGFCAALSTTTRQKLLATLLLVCASTINYTLGHSILWYSALAGLCITWLDVIPLRLPRFVIPLLTGAAGGSLFIYLTHFQFRSLLRHLLNFELHGSMPWPWLSIAFSMVGGYFMWQAWNFASQLAVRPLRRWGIRDVRLRPTDSGL